VREQAPLAAASQDIEDRVEDLAETVDPRSSMPYRCRHVRFDVGPFGIRKVCWVRSFLIPARVANYRTRTLFIQSLHALCE
jgi:hypothetical protein